jgi:hypothetical protein
MYFVLKFPADSVSDLKCGQRADARRSRQNVSKGRNGC